MSAATPVIGTGCAVAPSNGRRIRHVRRRSEDSIAAAKFLRWWRWRGWPQRHGGMVYAWGGDVDHRAVLRLMRSPTVAGSVDRARVVAETFLDSSALNISDPKRSLHTLAAQLHFRAAQAHLLKRREGHRE